MVRFYGLAQQYIVTRGANLIAKGQLIGGAAGGFVDVPVIFNSNELSITPVVAAGESQNVPFECYQFQEVTWLPGVAN